MRSLRWARAIILGFCIASLSFASNAYAETQGPLTIAYVGTQGDMGYAAFTTPFSQACNWNNVYFSLADDAGKAALSVLLTAHASGRPISRIDYTRDSQGQCWLDLVQL